MIHVKRIKQPYDYHKYHITCTKMFIIVRDGQFDIEISLDKSCNCGAH